MPSVATSATGREADLGAAARHAGRHLGWRRARAGGRAGEAGREPADYGRELREPRLADAPDKKLNDEQVADLKNWVKLGAPFPDTLKESSGAAAPTKRGAIDKHGVDLEQGRKFWAFQPPRDRPSPRSRDAAWPARRSTASSLPRSRRKGCARAGGRQAHADPPGDVRPDRPAADAGRRSTRSWPTTRPDAFARVVDRLLASPHYGERWGRHWLDVARYADSNGLDENVAHGNAWRYRDYVVAAFNADKPYDQFVSLEQLAGDLLPRRRRSRRPQSARAADRHRLPRRSGPKVLAEADETKMEMDIVDEQVDTVGRAFLGLTLGCARCHDHKFDPIPHGRLLRRWPASSRAPGRWRTSRRSPAGTRTRSPRRGTWHARRRTTRGRREARPRSTGRERAGERVKGAPADAGEKPPEEAWNRSTRTRRSRAASGCATSWRQWRRPRPEMPSAMGVTEGTSTDVHVHIRGSHLSSGAAVPRAGSAGPGAGPVPLGLRRHAERPAGAGPLAGRAGPSR